MTALPLEEIKEKPPQGTLNIVNIKKGPLKKQTSNVIAPVDGDSVKMLIPFKKREKILPNLKADSSMLQLDRELISKLADEYSQRIDMTL